MAIHKLADGPVTLTIIDVQQTEGKFGPQFQVTGTEEGSAEETLVFVSLKSFEQQVKRLNLKPEECIGETLHFEQVKKDGMTYTNITRSRGGKPVARAVSAPVAAPAPRMTPEEAGAIYEECVKQALIALGLKLEESGITVTAEAIQSAAATIFIKVTR